MSRSPYTFTEIDSMSTDHLSESLSSWKMNPNGSRGELIYRVMCALTQADLLHKEDKVLLSHKDFYTLLTDDKLLGDRVIKVLKRIDGGKDFVSSTDLTRATWIYLLLRANPLHLKANADIVRLLRISVTIACDEGFVNAVLYRFNQTGDSFEYTNSKHSYYAERIRDVYPFIGRLVVRDGSGELEVTSAVRIDVLDYVGGDRDRASKVVDSIKTVIESARRLALHLDNVGVNHTKVDVEGNIWITNVSQVTNYAESVRDSVWDVDKLTRKRVVYTDKTELLTPNVDSYLNEYHSEGQEDSPY